MHRPECLRELIETWERDIIKPFEQTTGLKINIGEKK